MIAKLALYQNMKETRHPVNFELLTIVQFAALISKYIKHIYRKRKSRRNPPQHSFLCSFSGGIMYIYDLTYLARFALSNTPGYIFYSRITSNYLMIKGHGRRVLFIWLH